MAVDTSISETTITINIPMTIYDEFLDTLIFHTHHDDEGFRFVRLSPVAEE